MSKTMMSVIVLVALLLAMGAGAFIGSQAGGGSPAMTKPAVMGMIPTAAGASASPETTPMEAVSPTPTGPAATALLGTPTASPPPTPSPLPPFETPVGDGTGI
ncbi:MAG: hypothetical protein M3R02_03395 [Chloroflexota bacterium]|nr:hypothetical protein [Chloroflexota bacterium]